MNANVSCLKAWTKYDWYLTNSLKTPMGPVFDQRWEGKNLFCHLTKKYNIYKMYYKLLQTKYNFDIALSNIYLKFSEFEEYKNFQDTYYVNKLAVEVKLSFSVRASHDAHILICNGTNYLKDSCYWIIIGGWHNTLSVLRKCATGVPLLGEFPAAGSKCREPLVSFKVNTHTHTHTHTHIYICILCFSYLKSSYFFILHISKNVSETYPE